MRWIAEVAGNGKDRGLLVLNLLLDQAGDVGLTRGEPGWGRSRGSRRQVELNGRKGLADGTIKVIKHQVNGELDVMERKAQAQ